MSRTARVLATAFVFLAVTCVLRSQEPAKTISVDVDVVLVPATVTNERGQYVGGLEAKDFQVFEDKVMQKITYFSTEDASMSLGIVLDSSGSMNPIMNQARLDGGACMSMGTNEDEYFLIVFSDQLKVNTDFTTDLRNLRSKLLTVSSSGSTALYDAIYAGLAKVREGSHPRKALVVVSDGYDNRSRYTSKNLRDALKESDVQLYLIGNQGDGGLRALAESTGGRSLSPQSRTFELGNICNEIVRNLKNQYLIGYRPTNRARDGKQRTINVKLSPPDGIKLNVRARTNYYAPSDKN